MEVHILVCANRVDFMEKARYDKERAGRTALRATPEGRCLKYKSIQQYALCGSYTTP